MAETRHKRTFEAQISLKSASLKRSFSKTPSLEEITPASYAKLTARQRKELMLKLIEFLKSI